MAIDRIGKGPSSVPAKPATGADRAGEGAQIGRTKQTEEPAKTFEVRPPARSASTPSTTAVAPTTAASTHLDRLRAGEIDLDRYLDLKVDDATAHLHGLGTHELESLRSLLREQLSSDPGLVDLVQQATGQRPTPKE